MRFHAWFLFAELYPIFLVALTTLVCSAKCVLTMRRPSVELAVADKGLGALHFPHDDLTMPTWFGRAASERGPPTL